MKNGLVVLIMISAVILGGCVTTKVAKKEKPVPAIRVDFQIVEIPSDAISLLGQKPRLDLDMVADLKKSGKAHVVTSQSITTLPGFEATIKGVGELIYPTELSYDSDSEKPKDKGVATIVGGVVEPGGFETREMGNILKVTPQLSETGLITLQLDPEAVGEPTWVSYLPTLSKDGGQDVSAGMKQPIFHTARLSTTVSLANGKTIVLGICPKPQVENVTLIYLIGANLVE